MEKSSANAPVDNVFVGNLSFFCTAEDLMELFQAHVPIRSASIVKTKSGLSSYYGFVYLENDDDASKVAEIFNGKKFMGRKMKIGIKSSVAAKQVVDGSTVQMFVRFLSEKVMGRITEETLDDVFSQFGEVADCIVKEYACFDASSPPVQSGYAFLHVRQIECAQSIIQRLSSECGKELNGIVFKVSLSHQCTERLQKSKGITKESHLGGTRQTIVSHPHSSEPSVSPRDDESHPHPERRERGGKTGNSRFFHGRTEAPCPEYASEGIAPPQTLYPQTQHHDPKNPSPMSAVMSPRYISVPSHIYPVAPPQYVPSFGNSGTHAWNYTGVPPVHLLSPVPTASPPEATATHMPPSMSPSTNYLSVGPHPPVPTMFHQQALVYPPGYSFPFPHSTPMFAYQMMDSSHGLAQQQGLPPRQQHP